MIEKNAHSSDLRQVETFCRVIEDRAHLLDGDAGEQIYELANLNSIFEVLKERGDRDSRATEHPRAAYALWITLDRWTRRPI